MASASWLQEAKFLNVILQQPRKPLARKRLNASVLACFHTSSQGARPQGKRRMAFSGLSGHSWTTWSFEDDPALISRTWQQTQDLSLCRKRKY